MYGTSNGAAGEPLLTVEAYSQRHARLQRQALGASEASLRFWQASLGWSKTQVECLLSMVPSFSRASADTPAKASQLGGETSPRAR